MLNSRAPGVRGMFRGCAEQSCFCCSRNVQEVVLNSRAPAVRGMFKKQHSVECIVNKIDN